MVDGIESRQEVQKNQQGCTPPVLLPAQVIVQGDQGRFSTVPRSEAGLKRIQIISFIQECLELSRHHSLQHLAQKRDVGHRSIAVPSGDEREGLKHPGLMLKYSTYKNLAQLAAQRDDFETAMEFYLEAVMLDSTDVNLWYKIGHVALRLTRLPLARHAFEEGLSCNPDHWPCLDNLITVLYTLSDYTTCLYFICKALERDCQYSKGLVIKEKIFEEQPCLRKDSLRMFLK
ncbi:Calcineurin-binding protein cabin-1, partial [Varanus komodoensis]